LRATWG